MAEMVKARELKHAADYLLRSQHNRNLPNETKLWADVAPPGDAAQQMKQGLDATRA